MQGTETEACIAIFGTNPYTNRPNECALRINKLAEIVPILNPSRVVFLGGETWADASGIHSEAGYMKAQALDQIPALHHCEVTAIEEGQETITQTDALSQWMKVHTIATTSLYLITTWHQLARAGIILKANFGAFPHFIRVPLEDMNIQDRLYDVWSFTAGCAYTSLVAGVRATLDSWHDGGPLVRKINAERESRTGHSGIVTSLINTRYKKD